MSPLPSEQGCGRSRVIFECLYSIMFIVRIVHAISVSYRANKTDKIIRLNTVIIKRSKKLYITETYLEVYYGGGRLIFSCNPIHMHLFRILKTSTC